MNHKNEFLKTVPTCADFTSDTWLAGLIDADGYLAYTKGGCVCEITTASNDAAMLWDIQRIYGGSVKPRSGSASVRWRVMHRAGMLRLCARINGHIRNAVRAQQLQQVCTALNMVYLPPVPLHPSSAYIAGLWDGDGSITITTSRSSPEHSVLKGTYGKMMRLAHSGGNNQLSTHIDSSDVELLHVCRETLGFGSVIEKKPSQDPKQRRPNVHYRLYWRSQDHMKSWQTYLKACGKAQSEKHARLRLVERYFELKSQKAHLAPVESDLRSQWHNFCASWYGLA